MTQGVDYKDRKKKKRRTNLHFKEEMKETENLKAGCKKNELISIANVEFHDTVKRRV